MIATIVKKDFLTNLVSPRFAIGFVLCLVLIPFSILINISSFQDRSAQYRLDRNAAEKAATEVRVYSALLPQHELRANLQIKRLQAEKGVRDAYYQAMFRQFERTRLVTALSPVSTFEYLAEAVTGGGYLRFRKVWGDMHVYQGQLLNFFKSLDAADKDSPHWYNPHEDISTTRKPVAFEKVPQFEERPLAFADRVGSALRYLVINIFMAGAVFFLSFILFVRYDVR